MKWGEERISCQYLQHSKQELIYKYHFYLVTGQVNPNFDLCQIISVYRQVKISDEPTPSTH